MDCSLPSSSVHGIFQAIVLEWIAISFSRGSSGPRNRTRVSRIAGGHFTIWIQQFHSCVFIWRKWKHYLKYLHTIFIDKSFTTAKTWKQPKCSSMTWMNKENVMHTYNGILFNQKQEGTLAICNNMDRLWGHSLVAQTVNNLPSVQETRVWSLGQEDPLEEEMATHSSILA